eukprot:scaffold10145_cov116-Isochrysis_galbana.AAC.4
MRRPLRRLGGRGEIDRETDDTRHAHATSLRVSACLSLPRTLSAQRAALLAQNGTQSAFRSRKEKREKSGGGGWWWCTGYWMDALRLAPGGTMVVVARPTVFFGTTNNDLDLYSVQGILIA